MFRTILSVSAALAYFTRVQHYLLLESCTDYRLSLNKRNHRLGEGDEKGDAVIVILGATFGWFPRKPEILSNIAVNIRKASFTFVVRLVGLGKSTLLRAILGEVLLRAGSIRANLGNIALIS